MAQSPVEQHRARFEENPDARGAFEFLEEHWFMQEDWSALADLYRRRLAAPSLAQHPRQRAQLALRLGQLLEERLSDGDAAIHAYTAALRSDPQLQPAYQHLRRLYSGRRSWEMVLQIAEQEATIVGSAEERAQLYTEMGDIWRRELGDEAQAEQLYARARDERGDRPDSEPAPEGDDSTVHGAWLLAARGDTDAALASLQRALERDPTDVGALDMILTVLEGAERHDEMADLLERRAELATDAETRAAVLLRLGELREHGGSLGDAREAYERALQARPGHGGAYEALRRTYQATESWSALRTLLEDALQRSPDRARIPFLCDLAALLERQFGDSEAARARLEEAAALAPDDPRILEARSQLGLSGDPQTSPDDEPSAGGEQRTTRVLGVLERKLVGLEARGQGATREAYRLRLRIAELLAGSLGDPAAALDVLEAVIENDDAVIEIAPTLARLYDQRGQLERLAELAERAGHLADLVDQRIDWLRRAAETARALGDPVRAIDCYQSLLAENPRDAAARRALCDLYRGSQRFEPLVELLRAELPRAEEGRELQIHLELAQIFADALDDRPSACTHLRRCLELEPTQLGLLERALELCDDPLAQLDLIELATERSPDDGTRAALLARRGTLLAETLAWEEEALASWRASLALDPDQHELRAKLGASGARTATPR